MITIRQANLTDIQTIAKLANDVWPVAYKDILAPAQMKYMLQKFYSYSSLQKEINVLHHSFILATDKGKAVGFASYSVKNSSQNIYKLHKLYILPGQQGKGIGKHLLDHIIRDIKTGNAKILELNVNRQNNARSFYEKSGFRIIDEQDIPIGKGYFMNDFVMQKVV